MINIVACTFKNAPIIESTPSSTTFSSIKPSPTPPASATTKTQPPEGIEIISHLAGEIGAITIYENYAYVNVGTRLKIVDISNPEKPFVAGISDSLPGTSTIELVNQFGFMLIENGLLALSFSEPLAPRLIATLQLPEMRCRGLALGNGYAYIAAGDTGFKVIDINNPAVPYLVSSLEIPGCANNVVVTNRFAYLTFLREENPSANELWVIDISDPFVPRVIRMLQLEYISDIQVKNQLVFFIEAKPDTTSSTLKIIDVDDTLTIRQIGAFDFSPGQAYANLIIAGQYIFVLGSTCELGLCYEYTETLDISNPADIRRHQKFKLGSDVNSINKSGQFVIVEGYAYITNSNSLQIYDYVNDDNFIGRILLSIGEVNTVELEGNLAYLSVNAETDQPSLKVVDVVDPTSPIELGAYNLLPHCESCISIPHDISVNDEYVYLGMWMDGIEIINASNPLAMSEVAHLPVEGYVLALAVSTDYLYVMQGTGIENDPTQLLVFNVTEKAKPQQISTLIINSDNSDHVKMAIHNDSDRIFAVNRACTGSTSCQGQLVVIDITNPVSPQIDGKLDIPEVANVAVDANDPNYIYLSTRKCASTLELCSELWLTNVTDPKNPYKVFMLEELNNREEIATAGSYVYWGRTVVDVRNPLQPVIIDSNDALLGNSIARGNYIYIAGGSSGLLILKNNLIGQ